MPATAVPGRVPNTMTLNFEGGADDIPTFSFADLRACAVKNDKDYFRRWFAGKVVIFGSVLDIEDRRQTSKRFATGIEGARAPRCAAESTPVTAGFRISTIAGVYIHATAVNNLISRNAVVEPGPLVRFLISALFAALAAVAAWRFRPLSAALAWMAVIVASIAGATIAFNHALALPIAEPFLASLFALAATIGFRFVVADKDRRLLQKSFALYLAPHVINRMLSSNKLPELGGETRNVTVFFSDIEGFSLIAEKMSPDSLMELMNEYLSAMTDVIERHGGYVDKYIGDFIVAVFGAPADDPDHAANAARAALDCCTQLAELNASSAAFQEYKLAQRIGINSGEALVGNFGSRRRFNYSVMSDAVNLASRLEGANKFYGTTVIASETTVALTGEAFAWRELDAIRVKGRTQALKIYELLARVGRADRLRRRHPDRQLRRRACAVAGPRIRPRRDTISAVRPTSTGRQRCFAIAPGNWPKSRRARTGTRSGRCRKNVEPIARSPGYRSCPIPLNKRCRSSARIAGGTRRRSNPCRFGSGGRIDRDGDRVTRRAEFVATSGA